jgi:hypothetical protein
LSTKERKKKNVFAKIICKTARHMLYLLSLSIIFFSLYFSCTFVPNLSLSLSHTFNLVALIAFSFIFSFLFFSYLSLSLSFLAYDKPGPPLEMPLKVLAINSSGRVQLSCDKTSNLVLEKKFW